MNGKSSARADRDRRLADKLRENLKRRKAQIRGRGGKTREDVHGDQPAGHGTERKRPENG
jgi:hypothetical protein